MTLDATVGVRRGDFELRVELVVAPGEVLALLGPNGAGKTTVLRTIAGLVALDDGRVNIDGQLMDDPARNVFVPAERRPIGVVFQDYLLFQHLSALENVAFGLRARGVRAARARHDAAVWLERVGLSEHATKRPQQLSGGQSQRVALARALATDPRVLLLDEPLAALDVGTRGEVRRDLRRYMASFEGMRLLVTHDPVDAYALADRIAVLENGRVVQCGTISDITAHPRSRYVADLVGVNLVAGVADGDTVSAANGAEVTIADRHLGPVFVAIAPTAVALSLNAPDGASARNVWEGTVADIDRLGDRARVVVDGPIPMTAEVTTRALAALSLQPGDRVYASVKATEITVYPAVSERLLLGEWACLGILYPKPIHGFAVAAKLKPDAEIGRVWSMSRALTYRCLDQLQGHGYVHAIGEEPGIAGGNRTILANTCLGRATLRRWLNTPVAHLRDLRSELLLKLVLADYCGIDVSEMLVRQRADIEAMSSALRSQADETDQDVVLLWRAEFSEGALRFLDGLKRGRR